MQQHSDIGAKNSRASTRRLLYILIVLGLIASSLAGAYTAHKAYRLAYAYTLREKYVSDEIYYVDTARRYLVFIFKVDINYYNWSGKTGNDYFNLEHPPLGKYLIALSMVLCGDKPICWRMPGIIEAGLIPIILYLPFAAIARRRGSPLLLVPGVVAALAAAGDRILFTDASVAMLDIHLAFFVALTIAFVLMGREKSALIAGALATGVKMSGLAALAGIVLYKLVASIYERNPRVFARALVAAFAALVAVYGILYIPLVAHFGISKVVEDTLNALKWHTTSRPPGPPTSTPIGWLFNSNPFFFSFSLVYAAAVTTPLIEATAFALSVGLTVVCLILASRRSRVCGGLIPGGAYVLVSIFLMYAGIWIMGNHTFYSFYAVELTPAAASTIGETILLAAVLYNRSGEGGRSMEGEAGGDLQGNPVADEERLDST